MAVSREVGGLADTHRPSITEPAELESIRNGPDFRISPSQNRTC